MLVFWFAMTSLIPSTDYSVLLPNCTLLDHRLTQLIDDFDNMRSEAVVHSEIGMRLQEFRETIINTASDVTFLSKC